MPKVKTERKFRNHKNEATTKGAVQKQGIQFNKDFGQHILKNPLIITSMIDKVSLSKSNHNLIKINFLFLGSLKSNRYGT
jgi:hypothetical protein